MNQDKLIPILYNYVHQVELSSLLSLDKDFTISFLAQGEYNRNYILEDSNTRYVLRVNFGSQIIVDNQIEYEYSTIKSLEHSGVTPKGILLMAVIRF